MEVWLLFMDGCGLSIGLDGEHSLDYRQDATRGSLLVVLWSSLCLRKYKVAFYYVEGGFSEKSFTNHYSAD